MVDQPTAETALEQLEPLVGRWMLKAVPPNGEPWPGEAWATFEWMEGGPFLIERSHADLPETPDSVSIIGCDAANGTYYQLYSDERNVCRVYEMAIGDGDWKLWREGVPFAQRFTGRFTDDDTTIEGRWELNEGDGWKTDFDLTYTKVR
jgi:hypothetical protein